MNEQDGGPSFLDYAGLGLMALCFGATFYFNALVLDWLSPLGSNAARLITAAAFMVPVSFLAGHGLPGSLRQWLWVSGLGVFGMLLPFLFIFWAQTHIPSNVVAGIFTSIPLLMLVFSRAFLKVRVTGRKWFGLLVGAVGLLMLAGPGTLSQIGAETQYAPQLAVFMACVLLAGAAIVMRLIPKAPPVQTLSGALVAAAVVSVPIVLFEAPEAAPSLMSLFGLIGVGAISTGLGNLLRIFLIQRRGPVFITPNAYLATSVAVLLGVVLLGEALTPVTLIAFAVIFAGIVIAQDGSGNMRRL